MRQTCSSAVDDAAAVTAPARSSSFDQIPPYAEPRAVTQAPVSVAKSKMVSTPAKYFWV